MENDMKNTLARSIFRFRKASISLMRLENTQNMNEIMVLGALAKSACHSDGESGQDSFNNIIAEMSDEMHISKSAVSQMLGTMERKGYVKRETDPADRRRVIVQLMPEGRAIAEKMIGYADNAFSEMISRFGESNTEQFISLINKLADVIDDMRREKRMREGFRRERARYG